MKKLIIAGLVAVFVTLMFAITPVSLASSGSESSWARTYGGEGIDYAYSVIQTSDGGYVLVGIADADENSGVLLVKTNNSGNEEWRQTFENGGYAGWQSVVQAQDGGFLIAGTTKTVGLEGLNATTDIWIAKTDNLGDIQWAKTFGFDNINDAALSLIRTSDGGYMITGAVDSVYLLILKMDADGNEEWRKTDNNRWPSYSIVQTIDGGYALLDREYADNIRLLKTDNVGNIVWQQTYNVENNRYSEAYSLIQTLDGGYAIAGYSGLGTFWFYLGTDAPHNDFFLLKTDNSGNEEWSKTFDNTDQEAAFSMIQSSDGGYVLAGAAGRGGGNILIVKTDNEGNMQWRKLYDNLDWANSIIQTKDGGYAVAGWTYSNISIDNYLRYSPSGPDFLLIKTDASGDVGGWPPTLEDLPTQIGINSLVLAILAAIGIIGVLIVVHIFSQRNFGR